MEAFNIHLANKDNLALTILFADEQYKIIYDGGIIGALTFEGNQHHFIPQEDVEPGQLPLYDYKKTNESITTQAFIPTEKEIKEIAEEVKKVVRD